MNIRKGEEGTLNSSWVPSFFGGMGKKVGLTYDLKTDWEFKPGDPADANAELDSGDTVNYITQALQAGGHQVSRIGNVRNLLQRIAQNDLDVDIVFNICEGLRGRNRESEVPVMLEMMGIPFVGADGLTLGVTLDKILAKKCFLADGIPTAPYFEAGPEDDLEKLNTIGYPLFVKPKFEGTSKGLTENSRVADLAGLQRQVRLINEQYHQSALVEKFIKGTEFTVPVLGNDNPQAMPVVQISIEGTTNLGNKFFTFSHVVAATDLVQYLCPAPIDAKLTKKFQDIAVRAYKSVGCRDFGRVDLRVDEQGNPYVLEINPLPSLAKKDVFNQFPAVVGWTYAQTINTILNFALKRYDLCEGPFSEREVFETISR